MTSSSTDPSVAQKGAGCGVLEKSDHPDDGCGTQKKTFAEVVSITRVVFKISKHSEIVPNFEAIHNGYIEIHLYLFRERMMHLKNHPIAIPSGSSGRSTFLRFSFFLSYLLVLALLFITTKSVLSFTCLPQTTFWKESTSTENLSWMDRMNHQPLSQQHSTHHLRSAGPPMTRHSNTNFLMMPFYQQCSKNSPSKRLNIVRWGVKPLVSTRNKATSSSLPSRLHSTSSSSSSSPSSMNRDTSSSNNKNGRLVTAIVDSNNNNNNNKDEIEAIQMIFTNYCDADGLMTKMDVRKVPYIADLLVRFVP